MEGLKTSGRVCERHEMIEKVTGSGMTKKRVTANGTKVIKNTSLAHRFFGWALMIQ